MFAMVPGEEGYVKAIWHVTAMRHTTSHCSGTASLCGAAGRHNSRSCLMYWACGGGTVASTVHDISS